MLYEDARNRFRYTVFPVMVFIPRGSPVYSGKAVKPQGKIVDMAPESIIYFFPCEADRRGLNESSLKKLKGFILKPADFIALKKVSLFLRNSAG